MMKLRSPENLVLLRNKERKIPTTSIGISIGGGISYFIDSVGVAWFECICLIMC